jgi:sugar lactone lactonase YvrE
VTAAEPWSEPCAYHAEGPVWHDASGSLLWVDMLAGDVLRSSDGRTTTRHHVGDVVAALRSRRAGGHVLALERSFALCDDDFVVTEEIAVWDDPSVRFNEGACDPTGRFYAGSMAYDAREGGATLYVLGTDLSVAVALPSVTVSNGLVWQADGDEAYYVDTATQRIDALRLDPATGAVVARRPVVTVPAAAGSPDGMTLDEHGNLWVALWDGAAVHAYSPSGELLDVVEVGARRVTACTFGGPDLDRLFITTSRFELDDPEPTAGAVHVADVGVRGHAPYVFGA